MSRIARADGTTLWDDARLADSFLSRLKGLIGRKGIGPEEAMVFEGCHSVHMMFMSCPIDVIALMDSGAVAGVDTVRPWQRVPRHDGTSTIVEAQAGSASGKGVRVGDTLCIEGSGR